MSTNRSITTLILQAMLLRGGLFVVLLMSLGLLCLALTRLP